MKQLPVPAPSPELHGVVPSVCDAEAGPGYIVAELSVTLTRSTPQALVSAAAPSLAPSGYARAGADFDRTRMGMRASAAKTRR
jgi:hypothetical protein